MARASLHLACEARQPYGNLVNSITFCAMPQPVGSLREERGLIQRERGSTRRGPAGWLQGQNGGREHNGEIIEQGVLAGAAGRLTAR